MKNPQVQFTRGLSSEAVSGVVPEAVLLTIPEAAHRLKVGRTRVFDLIKEGELAAVRFGPRSTRVPADSVDALIARMREQPTPTSA